MLHIKRFIDKIASMEAKQSKDLVLPIMDARGLRDDVSKLLAELHELNSNREATKNDEIVQVEIKGGSFK